MIRKRKETAWKKNRRLGDIKGGRTSPKFSKILQRYHNLEPPLEGDEPPIFFEDNPSRNFFHPVGIQELKIALDKLPKEVVSRITHVWLKKIKQASYEKGETYQACFIRGDKVSLIILNAFPKDLKMAFGRKQPSKKIVKFYGEWETNWKKKAEQWYLQWSKESIKKYYLEHLLLHEIGHLVDSENKRFYSKAKAKQKEDFANNYAIFWNNQLREKINLE